MLQVNFQPFPTLTTQRLLLRAITTNDVAEIFEFRSSKTIMQYIDRPLAQTQTDALNYIDVIINSTNNNVGITWGIALQNEPKIIGTIGFWRIDKENYRAEIGYMLHNKFHRQGIMQEAMIAVLHYGFNTLQLHSVEANVNPLNAASVKILEKNNFVLEAHFKENYYYNGKFLDSYIYSLLASNFKQ